MTATPQQAARPRSRSPFYGWWVVAVSFLNNVVHAGAGITGYGLFLIPMGAELGWSRGAMGAAMTVRASMMPNQHSRIPGGSMPDLRASRSRKLSGTIASLIRSSPRSHAAEQEFDRTIYPERHRRILSDNMSSCRRVLTEVDGSSRPR